MSVAATPKPANGLVRISADGQPWICGYRCARCGAVAAAPTMACRRCASRDAPWSRSRPSKTGTLYSWSVVERSYPGVKTPFVSAIVDLEDGLTLKGTLKTPPGVALKVGHACAFGFRRCRRRFGRTGPPLCRLPFRTWPLGGNS